MRYHAKGLLLRDLGLGAELPATTSLTTVSWKFFFTKNSYLFFDFLVVVNEFYCFSTLYMHTYVSFVFLVFLGDVAA